MITLIGVISKPLTHYSINNTRTAYVTEISVKRKSGVRDLIPVVFYDAPGIHEGIKVHIEGQICSLNKGSHNEYFVLVSSYYSTVNEPDTNFARISCHICKEPISRQTPSGRRIVNLLVAVNTFNGHSDYIPCIVWESSSDFAKKLSVGDHVDIAARFQSREYTKNNKAHTAYELSVSFMDYA